MSRPIDPLGETHRFKRSHEGTARGQLEAKQIIGSIILLVIGKPLLNAGAQFQASLSTTSVLSEIEATVVALLFVIAIAAAALGFE